MRHQQEDVSEGANVQRGHETIHEWRTNDQGDDVIIREPVKNHGAEALGLTGIRRTWARLVGRGMVLLLTGAGLVACSSSTPPGETTTRPTVPDTSAPQTSAQGGASLPGPTGASGIALGIYVKPEPSQGGQIGALQGFETSVGRRLAILQTFTGWQTQSGAMIPFPEAFASYAASTGATPMITWQPEQAVTASETPTGLLLDQPNFSLAQLSSGRYDGYIRAWADQAKRFGRTIYVRPMQEMNDPVYPWSIGVNGNTDPDEFIAAWRHIVGIFASEGATNVQFVWCVGANPASPSPAEFFPGDSYTSWIALDGYNRGNPWKSFTSIFSAAYTEITTVSSRPVMVAEMGSVENESDPTAKADWITSALGQEIPQAFPRVGAVLYFDAPGRGFSYALSSSSAALDAFKVQAASAHYQGDAPT